jgi:tRNA/tmRNA/rRNA uracil-C5-methylase (TrmA/RlmC/RlmD family)
MTNLAITDIAFGGKGVGRTNGKAVFVPYVIDGETVSANIVREHKKFIEAELQTVQIASPHRVEPRCPYFGSCGGCVYQHVNYKDQLAIKTRQVEQTLTRIGKITNAPMRPIIPSPIAYEYRNRITVHVREGIIGFFRRESNNLLDIERCPIASDKVNAELAQLRSQHPREGHYTLREHDSARVFTQANDAVALVLLELVERLLQSSTGRLIDGYCGAGFFAKRLCPRFDHVVGIDWDREAIAQAKKNARSNEEYIAGDVDGELCGLLESGSAGVVILDPPQTGLSRKVQAALIRQPPARLIYVSCNPATLARDLALLRNSFRIDSITPLDMFPQTAAVEVVAALHA